MGDIPCMLSIFLLEPFKVKEPKDSKEIINLLKEFIIFSAEFLFILFVYVFFKWDLKFGFLPITWECWEFFPW